MDDCCPFEYIIHKCVYFSRDEVKYVESKLESSCFQIVCSCSIDASDSSPSAVIALDSSLPAIIPSDSSFPAINASNSSLPAVNALNSSSPASIASDNSSPAVDAPDSCASAVEASNCTSSAVNALNSRSSYVDASDSSSSAVDVSDSFLFSSDASKLNFSSDIASNSYINTSKYLFTPETTFNSFEAVVHASSSCLDSFDLSMPGSVDSSQTAFFSSCCSPDRDSSLARSCSLGGLEDGQDDTEQIHKRLERETCCREEEEEVNGGRFKGVAGRRADVKGRLHGDNGHQEPADRLPGDFDDLVRGRGLFHISETVTNTLKDVKVGSST